MAFDLRAAVAAAVKAGLEARARFYASMQEPDEQLLAPAATHAQVEHLQAMLGVVLPPSYREFLLLHDGWRMVNANADLYSCTQVESAAKDAKLKKWRAIASDAGETFAATAIVIGGSRFAATKYLLDTTRVDAAGEMSVVEHDKTEQDRYPSFLEFLRRSAGEFEEAADDIDSGLDFSNI